jgi:hypothetical protein
MAAALDSEKESSSHDALHSEDADVESDAKEVAAPQLKLDAHGLPLVPQPSDAKDDPLVSALYL